MTEIVNDTSTILTAIGDVDLKGLCGEEAEPNGSDECNEALGSLNFYYNSLEGQLDAWSPYL